MHSIEPKSVQWETKFGLNGKLTANGCQDLVDKLRLLGPRDQKRYGLEMAEHWLEHTRIRAQGKRTKKKCQANGQR